MKKIILKISLSILTIVILFLVGFYLRFGGSGRDFPNLSGKPVLPETSLEVVAELPEPPGNLAVSKSGRIFFTYHAESRPDTKVLELVDGKPVPYPNLEMQKYSADRISFDAIFNLRIDSKNRLWTLDHGFNGLRKPRLIAFDLDSNLLVHEYVFPENIAGFGSYIQDMQIDPKGETIYIADIGVLSGKPSLIIYDINSKSSRRVLVNHSSIKEEDYTINAQGKKMLLLGGLFWMHPAFDPIALDRRGEWLYIGPMSGESLYRVKTSDLKNESLSSESLSSKVEFYATKPQCDGLTISDDDTIFLTGIEHGSIFTIDRNRKLQTLIQSERMRWPDGLSFGSDGWIYIADSDIPDVLLQSKSHIASSAPFYIYRFKTNYKAMAGQ